MARTRRDFNRKHAALLLSGARRLRAVSDRMEWISRQFLGFPYRECPLGGSKTETEVLTASLDGFDCVTYVETVLALARSAKSDEFVRALREMRYRGGEVSWKTRNHYMTGWIRENVKAGFISNETRGRGLVRRERRLDVVPGIPEHTIRVASIAKQDFMRRFDDLETGDLVFFVSTRKNLDVFHCGVIVRIGEEMRMRHASRSQGIVVEQPLERFLSDNRMSGLILVRPVDGFRHAA